MSLAAPTPRRCVPVRLSEVPLPVRLKGARAAIRQEQDPFVRAEILHHALAPSDRVYYVAA